jgi:putative flippase GtrA
MTYRTDRTGRTRANPNLSHTRANPYIGQVPVNSYPRPVNGSAQSPDAYVGQAPSGWSDSGWPDSGWPEGGWPHNGWAPNEWAQSADPLVRGGPAAGRASPAAGRGPPRRGRHRAPPQRPSLDGMRRLLGEHGARFASFSVVGVFVFVLGLALQALLVQVYGMGSIASFLVQGFVSVQVSFLLNYYWTWRDKDVPFWSTCYKFNVQKIITTIFNTVIYVGLVAVHMNYLVANVATTAIFTVVNYMIGNSWTFIPSKGKNSCPPP